MLLDINMNQWIKHEIYKMFSYFVCMIFVKTAMYVSHKDHITERAT